MRYICSKKMRLLFFALAFTWLPLCSLDAQINPFDILIQPVTIPDLGGIQSYAHGQSGDKWLIIGGRLDGLHRRQPFASFDIDGHNKRLFVVDPAAMKSWSASVESLPKKMQEQLSSTNMEFFQTGKYLYLIGGYGYSPISEDHQTFPYMTAVDVPAVINAIIAGKDISPYFRLLEDDAFAVTGGQIEQINNTYYIVGGQQFSGRYNPMGPDHGPGFIQTYSNSIRKFQLKDDGKKFKIKHLKGLTDTIQLHRRDYNAAAQIMPDGKEGITAFSGVFQYNFDIPYLQSVDISSKGYQPNPHFSQYYNHYHCPTLPLYSVSTNEMHTVFFGGIAQYHDSLGVLTQNNNVPFVNTISRISRDAKGKMTEYKLPVEMPGLLGAGAEFLAVENLPQYPNGVLKLDSLVQEQTLIGYIYGGISSSAPNIFWVNEGEHSSANQQIFKVFLIKNNTSKPHQLNAQSAGTLQMQVMPSPFLNPESFQVKFYLDRISDVQIQVLDAQGKQITNTTLKQQPPGAHFFTQAIENPESGGTYYFTIIIPDEKVMQKVVIEP